MTDLLLAQCLAVFLAGLLAGSIVSYAVAYYSYRKVLAKALDTLQASDAVMDAVIANLKPKPEKEVHECSNDSE